MSLNLDSTRIATIDLLGNLTVLKVTGQGGELL